MRSLNLASVGSTPYLLRLFACDVRVRLGYEQEMATRENRLAEFNQGLAPPS